MRPANRTSLAALFGILVSLFHAGGAFAQEVTVHTTSGGSAVALVPLIVVVIFSILMIAAFWKVLSKAGQPGWASIVPIYNLIALAKAGGMPAWWGILVMFVPILIVVPLISLAKSFGKGAGYGIGLWLLPVIFFPMLGFGSARHVSAGAAEEHASAETPEGEAPAAPAPAGPVAPAKNLTLYGVLAILATLCFLTLVGLQVAEYMYYGSSPSAFPVTAP